LEDDLLFLKWCPNRRDRCYHAISRDLSARPHEILGLKLKDIVFKRVGSKQYAEVLINGKTGARYLPLIGSLPYIKEWSDHHPQRNNPDAYFICSFDRKAFAKQMTLKGLQYIYKQYKKNYFPKLLKDSTIPIEDKRKMEELLKKPWNLYIRSALSPWNVML
jgi:integrase/recombinase XerD